MKQLTLTLLFTLVTLICSVATAAPAAVAEAISNTTLEAEESSAVTDGKLDEQAIEQLTETTEQQIKKKELALGKDNAEREQILIEKKAIEQQVKIKQKELELKQKQAETEIKEATDGSRVAKLKQEMQRLQSEYQQLNEKLDTKNQQTSLALEAAKVQHEEIESLRAQLKTLNAEQVQRISPRRKALYILLIIAGTMGAILLKNYFINRLDIFLTPSSYSARGARNLRYRTIARIISWLISLSLVTVAGFIILEMFGFNSTTLLAGAGIFGIAFGFGAQFFIKDVISGMFIVIEGQYSVNDFVQISGHKGTVEDVNLRFTKLRDLEGSVVFVPNGEVKTVINFAKDFAHALVTFYLDYDEDVDRAIALIEEVGADIRKDERFDELILGDVNILGVSAFTPTGVEIKFRIKTIPNSQWPIAREMRRRLKSKMSAAGMRFFQFGSQREQTLQPDER